ncbi:M23 family metallopeptidase [Limnothrix sp. FACHB-708]|nr:M23 family metallopeptidase [Limnothrix sp. FACHB-708]
MHCAPNRAMNHRPNFPTRLQRRRRRILQGLGWVGAMTSLLGGLATPIRAIDAAPSGGSADLAPEAPAAPPEPKPAAQPDRPTRIERPAPAVERTPQRELPNVPRLAPSPEERSTSRGPIDQSNDFNLGATQRQAPPSEIQFTERSTGCASVGGRLSAGCTVTRSPGQPGQAGHPGIVAIPTGDRGSHLQMGSPMRLGSVGSALPAQSPISVKIGPLTVGLNGVNFDANSYYFRSGRPKGLLGNGNLKMLFPLTSLAPISSSFGWRVHPILGYSRFHAGTDLSAPLGTPVVAVLDGKVSIGGFLGGYGLTVVLDHGDTQKTLYGHLSEIFVKPGATVKQGEVIGRVGSTGMSTGPHLHFEVRQLTAQGWVVTDPAKFLAGASSPIAATDKPKDPFEALMAATIEAVKSSYKVQYAVIDETKAAAQVQ